MRKLILLMLVIAFLVFCGAAMAQMPGGGDVLGAHNVNGHGCASCHAPHSGAAGNGGANADADTGNQYLWGRTFVAASYTQSSHSGTPNAFSVSKTLALTDPTLFHTAACLSCHDGAVQPIGMTGTSLETVDGTNHAPTYIGTGDVAGDNLKNDHPVHVSYEPNDGTCTSTTGPTATCSPYNWPSTMVNNAISFTRVVARAGVADVDAEFAKNYPSSSGHPARFYYDSSVANSLPMVECSTCHNPHSYKVIVGTAVQPANFFMRGWYNGQAGNSATQFCRSCHYSKANEYYGVAGITTN
jgi:hypothetical protein